MKGKLAAAAAALTGIATGLYLTWGPTAVEACCYWKRHPLH